MGTMYYVAVSTAVVLVATYIGSFYNESAANVWFKVRLFATGAGQMVLSQDRKWEKQPDADIIRDAKDIQTKQIIFIRHGESDWNEVFNRGFGPSFLVRLFNGIVREIQYLVTQDSLFFDSPLSELGEKQADDLLQFLDAPLNAQMDEDEGKLIVNGEKESDAHKSILVCSNLRRAIATATIVLQSRMKRTKEPLYMLSSLQEISRNVDTIALALPHAVPDMHGLDKYLEWPGYSPKSVYDVHFNYGNKDMLASNGMKRMHDFCQWTFERAEDTIIVGGGHSLWNREFFRTFLPKASNYEGKNKKMVNCGVIRFTLQRGTHNGRVYYRIDPDSPKTVYGGFSNK